MSDFEVESLSFAFSAKSSIPTNAGSESEPGRATFKPPKETGGGRNTPAFKSGGTAWSKFAR